MICAYSSTSPFVLTSLVYMIVNDQSTMYVSYAHRTYSNILHMEQTRSWAHPRYKQLVMKCSEAISVNYESEFHTYINKTNDAC